MNEKEIIEFYKQHTLGSTAKQFGLSTFSVEKILSRNNISKHTRAESIRLGMLEKYGVENASQVAEIHEKQLANNEARKSKISAALKGSKVCTNGTSNKRILPGSDIPEGFETGVTRKPVSKEKRQEQTRKAQETLFSRYGVYHYNELPEMRERLRQLATKEEVKRRAAIASQTKLDKYGDENFNNREKAAETCLKRYGVSNVSQLPYIIQKIFETKRRNGTVNTSKPEEELYEKLVEEYGQENVLRQYKDKLRYPFRCDFYIKSEDLFIELNAHWTHGGRPWNQDDPECQKQLAIWQEKAKEHPAYADAIQTWCFSDTKKAQTAKENKLNYISFYN